jgi:hypothetical protein
MSEPQQDDLSAEAWKLLGEILHTGQCKLKSGKVYAFDESGLLKTIQWVASLQKKGRKLLPTPSDYILPQTAKGGSHAKSHAANPATG